MLYVFFFHERNISRLSACRRENRLEEPHTFPVLLSSYFFGLQHLPTPHLSVIFSLFVQRVRLAHVGKLGGGGVEPTRETGTEWPLQTVETEANGDSRSTHEKDPSLIGSLGSSCRYKRFLSCLGCYNRPSTKYFFLHRTLFHFIFPLRPASWAGSCAGFNICFCLSPLPSKQGRQSCWVTCLLICASGANNIEKASGLFQLIQCIQTAWGNDFSYKKTWESIIIPGESFSFKKIVYLDTPVVLEWAEGEHGEGVEVVVHG